MKGNKIVRVGQIATHLLTHPGHIGPYLSTGPFAKKTPLELGLPWFSLSSIEFLQGFLKPEMEVFEYGSGGSTVFLAPRVRSVTSVEHHEEWVNLVKSDLQKRGIENVALSQISCDFNVEEFPQSAYLKSLQGQYDVIIIDGMESGGTIRPTCFAHAQSHIKPGGIIVVDDSWRYPKLHAKNSAKSFRVFKSTGPCRPDLTSTDIFFY